jgi:phosphoribosyl-ATP pyrophosphohydrolase
MAAKDGVREKVIYETADLWFHSLVLLAQQGIHPDEILAELARREGVSGIDEKSSRKEQA